MEGQRITEDGNLRITSTGDIRITQDYIRTNMWIVQPVSTDTWTCLLYTSDAADE